MNENLKNVLRRIFRSVVGKLTWDGGKLCNKFVIYACQFVLLG
jgi:hypothetical protein